MLEFIESLVTIKSFTDIFRKNKKIEKLFNGIIEERLGAILQNTIELCVTRFSKELPEEMVRYLLENEKVLQKVVDNIFSKAIIIEDDFSVEGYGLIKETQKAFIEYFFVALQNAMLRDIEIRRLFRQSEVYIEVDKIYDMTSVIYKKVDRIEDIFNELKQMNNLMERKISNIVKDNIVKLKFYLSGKGELSDTMNRISIKDLKELDRIDFIRTEIIELVDKIKEIKIQKKVEPKEVEDENNLFATVGKQLLQYNMANKVPVELSKENMDEVIQQLKQYINIDIDCEREEFFGITGAITGARYRTKELNYLAY